MGVYDKMEFNLKCKNCGAKELVIFLDQGSGWGFPEWVVITGACTQFNTTVVDGEVTKPKLEVKDCRECQSPDVEVKVG